jgi:hypothetical protein
MAESSRDAHGGSTLEWAPEQSTIAGRGHDAKRGHSGGSVKDKATRILHDSEVGTFGDISPHIKRSFVERRYSHSTGID